MSGLDYVKSTYSVALLIFSIVIIMGLISAEQTKLSSEGSPVLAYFAIWGAIIWLTMVEGGQASFVGLTPIARELYKDSHAVSHRLCEVCHEGDNLDRYLLGRQFMVVMVVFVVNMSGGPIENAELWGLPDIVLEIFLGSGLAMILFTCMVGQLNSQVNASHCMLDYINNFFATFTFWVAMAIEFSGLLHSSYVVSMLVSWAAGQKVQTNEPPRSGFASLFFWARCVFSVAVLIGCFAVTFEALFAGKTTMWVGVPEAVTVVIFFILMSVVGMLEGMQIAFFAVAKFPKNERGDSKFAKLTCDLLFKGDGKNLPGFMIGRQLTVVSCMFFVARVTSVKIGENEDGEREENIFGVSDGWQELFNTGLLGAMIVTICGSISWQLVASAFPHAFLANPMTYFLLRIALFLESTGICQGAWVLAAIHAKISGFQRDEVYVGTAEDRAKNDKGDKPGAGLAGPGHLYKLPGFLDSSDMPKALRELLEKDPRVSQFVEDYMDSSRRSFEANNSVRTANEENEIGVDVA